MLVCNCYAWSAWDNKGMLPCSSKISSPFQAHSHPVQHSPLTRSFSVSAGFGPPPVNGAVPLPPSTSNARRARAGTALRKRVNRPSLPSIPVVSQGGSFPRNSSGEPTHKVPHSPTIGRISGPKPVLRTESKSALDPLQPGDTGAAGAYRSIGKLS